LSASPPASSAPAPQPRIADGDSLAEFTFRAAGAGILFGIIFGSANAYLGLRVGLTVSTSIPIAVLSVALFRMLQARQTGSVLLEANLSQTVGSASSSLASGTIFTIPALFLWGMAPSFHQAALLALLGGILGIAAMIPLRRLLIVQSHAELPYPEGQACAAVLEATSSKTTSTGRWIFIGLALGAFVKLALGGFMLLPGEVGAHVPVLPKAELSLELAPALLAVGYILGFRQSAIMVSGSLISALVLTPLIALVGDGLTTPLFPEVTTPIRELGPGQIWSKYVRYIGAGAVAAAGIITVIRATPTMVTSFLAVARGLRSGASGPEGGAELPRTDRDLPGWVIIGGPIVVVLALALVPGLLAGNMSFGPRLVAALGVGLFGTLFVVVASRIVGLIGVSSNPVSAMTIVTLLGISAVFAANDWTDAAARAAIITVGTVVCVAASKAGDISQDLKTGYLVGATPWRQQAGQFLGAAFACWAVAGTVLLLGRTFEFGTPELPAPQATLMKTVVEGVLAGSLPWGLVGIGSSLSLSAMLAGLPGLTFAIGIYLPLATQTAIFAGGLVRWFVDRRQSQTAPEGQGKAAEGSNGGILAASGLIAGEGLAGVAIALAVAAREKFTGWANLLADVHFAQRGFYHLTGPAALVGGAVIVGIVVVVLWRSTADRGDG
jgi:putative OPT family oligopeptide transporter